MAGGTIELQRAVMDALEEYADEAVDVLQEEAEKAAKNAAQKLKAKKTFAAHPKKNAGAYARSWTSRVEKERLGVFAVTHNSKHYRLTHLLEHGHATRNGTGRVYDDTPAYPHIAQVNDEAQEEFLENVIRRLEG